MIPGVDEEVTQPAERTPTDLVGSLPSDAAGRFGRYRVLRQIGGGGFGDVFLAQDEELRRVVAVKVLNRAGPHLNPGDGLEDGLLEECRLLAQLSHPGIVDVYDVGRADDGRIFFASRFLDGQTLAARMKGGGVGQTDGVRIVADLADALAYAHVRGVIHRDVKPTNIVLVEDARPVLIDFGIATQSMESGWGDGNIMGTPGYMSPEQARGEGHLVDGRSDIFSLGVILYQILTGQRPFEGRPEDLLDRVASPTLDVCPLRQIDPGIPKALERICLKALAKRAADRYATADDLASELRDFLKAGSNGGQESSVSLPKVTPKGLRSFDVEDADFFLALLPGVRDQAGIPNGLRFWIRGIADETDPFRVGVLYGPSGSGKSSFIKAGLLPRLPRTVQPIFVQAGTGDLEPMLRDRLLREVPGLAVEIGRGAMSRRARQHPLDFLRAGLEEAVAMEGRHEPEPPVPPDQPSAESDPEPGESLAQIVGRLRKSDLLPRGARVLIVIDQFEQWLHRQDGGDHRQTDLFAALRQCDGRRVQFLLTVRDDFWMAMAGLMHDIDVELLQSKNASGIDLFDRDHARRVLREFGRAYGRVPPEGEASAECDAFIEAALGDMETDGRIFPMQLALFAEIAKAVPWSRDIYRIIGGRTAIGVEFLDSMFTRRSRNPAYRSIEAPTRAILGALLPAGTGTLKGQPIGIEELRQRSGLAAQPRQFESTLQALDQDLKLITPVEAGDRGTAERRYQLSHDYLVPALREWLHTAERATARGRARLRLRELAGAWQFDQDRRHLPSPGEWARIRLLTPAARWERAEAELMAAASARLRRQLGIALGLVALAGLALSPWFRHQADQRRLESLLAGPATAIEPWRADTPAAEQARVLPLIRQRLDTGDLPPQGRLNAALILAPQEPRHHEELLHALRFQTLPAVTAILEALDSADEETLATAWRQIGRPEVTTAEKLRLAALLARRDAGHEKWGAIGESAAHWLLATHPSATARWADLLAPVRGHLQPHVRDALPDGPDVRPPRGRAVAITLATWHQREPDELWALLRAVPPADIGAVIDIIVPSGEEFAPRLQRIIDPHLARLQKGTTSDPAAAREVALALVTLARIDPEAAAAPLAALLDHSADPTAASHLIRSLAPAGVGADWLYRQAISPARSPAQRAAYIQALGAHDLQDLPDPLRVEIQRWLLAEYQATPAARVQASIDWLLRHWGDPPPRPEPAAAPPEPGSARDWYCDAHGVTYAIITVPSDHPRADSMARRFAIATTETTLGDLRRAGIPVSATTTGDPGPAGPDRSPAQSLPPGGIFAYANWLSEKHGIPRDQWAYAPGADGALLPREPLHQFTGYRLPTTHEWIAATRAGAATLRYFGEGEDLIADYAVLRWADHREEPGLVARLKPNAAGLFDTLGNVAEVCHPGARHPDLAALTDCGGQAGGSADHLVHGARAYRFPLKGDSQLRFGFRLVRTLPAP